MNNLLNDILILKLKSPETYKEIKWIFRQQNDEISKLYYELTENLDNDNYKKLLNTLLNLKEKTQ